MVIMFFLGMFVGGVLGILIMALMAANGRSNGGAPW